MKIKRPMCLLCIAVLPIFFLYTLIVPPKIDEVTAGIADRDVTVTGTIEKREIKNDNLNLYLEDALINYYNSEGAYSQKSARGLVVYTDCEQSTLLQLKIGRRVKVTGTFALFDVPENDGQFDSRTYYYIRGYDGCVRYANVCAVGRGYNRFLERLYSLRERSAMVLDTFLDERDAAIMKAIVLGDKTTLDTDTKTLFQRAGISHILSLSGLHIASVGLCILRTLRKSGMGLRLSSCISSIVMLTYAIMTGLSTSTLRALIMFVLSVIAESIGRSYDLLSAAAVSAVLILVENPYYLYDSGFLLSFGSIVGIACVLPIIQELPRAVVGERNILMKRMRQMTTEKGVEVNPVGRMRTRSKMRNGWSKITHGILSGIEVSVAVTYTTLPITAKAFYRVSAYGVLANIIVVPLLGVLLALGFLIIAIGNIGCAIAGRGAIGSSLLEGQGVFDSLSAIRNSSVGGQGVITGSVGFELLDFIMVIMNKFTHAILTLYERVAGVISGSYGNLRVIGDPPMWECVVYYIILTLAVVICTKMLTEADNSMRKIHAISPKTAENRRVLYLTPILLVVVSPLIFAIRSVAPLEIRNLSVGQGDCAIITGRSEPVVVIDCGSTDVSKLGMYRILPALYANRIDRIDYFIVTHPDSDHVSGLLEILDDEDCGIEIDKIIISADAMQTVSVSDLPPDKSNYVTDRDREDLNANAPNNSNNKITLNTENVNLRNLINCAAARGVGIYGMKRGDVLHLENMDITCLSPAGQLARSDNDSSIVVMLTHTELGFRALFTGDITSDSEAEILRTGMATDADYLKVAHHGSKYSTSEDWLAAVSPAVAVISVGDGNSYGHPHQETLERLSRIAPNAKVLRTDECGQVTIKVDKNYSTPFIMRITSRHVMMMTTEIAIRPICISALRPLVDSLTSPLLRRAVTMGLYSMKVNAALSPPFSRLNGRNAGNRSLTTSERGVPIYNGVRR